jgi:hypothetical protein
MFGGGGGEVRRLGLREVRGEEGLLTQWKITELSRTSEQNVSLQIQNISEHTELRPEATVKESLTVQTERNHIDATNHHDWVRMGCPRIHEWLELRGVSGSVPEFKWGMRVREFEYRRAQPVRPFILLRP